MVSVSQDTGRTSTPGRPDDRELGDLAWRQGEPSNSSSMVPNRRAHTNACGTIKACLANEEVAELQADVDEAFSPTPGTIDTQAQKKQRDAAGLEAPLLAAPDPLGPRR